MVVQRKLSFDEPVRELLPERVVARPGATRLLCSIWRVNIPGCPTCPTTSTLWTGQTHMPIIMPRTCMRSWPSTASRSPRILDSYTAILVLDCWDSAGKQCRNDLGEAPETRDHRSARHGRHGRVAFTGTTGAPHPGTQRQSGSCLGPRRTGRGWGNSLDRGRHTHISRSSTASGKVPKAFSGADRISSASRRCNTWPPHRARVVP
jgi:hypothetical protein